MQALSRLIVCGILAAAGGCFDLDRARPTDSDAAANAPADGPLAPPPDGGPAPDGGPPPVVTDQSTALDCAAVLLCTNGCADKACVDACVARGTHDAQAKMAAAQACFQEATSGACAASCSDSSSAQCESCVLVACKAETDACMGAGGPPLAGFGDACSPGAQPSTCATGLQCMPLGEPTKGFCTKTCPSQGLPCDGAPEGMLAACIVGYTETSSYYCGFLCQVPDEGGQLESYPCPSTLICTDTPVTGQRVCMP